MTTAPGSPAPSPSATARTLDVPGARLHYEVRGAGPLVVLVGAPMDATSFAPLADLLALDHTVLTTDPRGINRSPVDDPDRDSTPALRADDLSRLLTHLAADPAVVVGSSGGAVSALALVQAHPEQVHTVVAHEPPLNELLEDREQLNADADDIVTAYLSSGPAAAWAKFLADANITLSEDDAAEWAPVQSERDPQEVADERHFFLHEMLPTTCWQPDLAVLRSTSTRIVVGIGDKSRDQLCERTSTALAVALGIEPTMFPGGHIGFAEDPDAFAARLRSVLRADNAPR